VGGSENGKPYGSGIFMKHLPLGFYAMMWYLSNIAVIGGAIIALGFMILSD
jgi:hypothetical protein